MTDEDKIYDEKEWNQRLYNDEKSALDSGDIVDAAIPSSYGTLGKSALSIAICNIKLDEEEILPYFAEAARHYIAKIDAVEEHRDMVDGSVKWNRPTHSFDALRAAVLAEDSDLIEEAIEQTLTMNSDEILEGDPSVAHVLYHVFGLASYLNADESEARDWLSKLTNSDHGYRKYDGLEGALGAVLDANDDAFTPAIETILEAHEDEYGREPDTAVGFISIDVFCYLKLGTRNGLELDRSILDPSLASYLPDPQFV